MATSTKDKDTATTPWEDPDRSPVGLGDAAAEALAGVAEHGATQDVLEGTDYTKVKFVGMAFDSLDKDIAIGDEKTFTVRARCMASGDEASKRDGQIRHIVKMDVQAVALQG